MTVSASPSVEALPHWEETPDDLPAAIRQIKSAIRASIESSGRSVEQVAQALEERIAERVMLAHGDEAGAGDRGGGRREDAHLQTMASNNMKIPFSFRRSLL